MDIMKWGVMGCGGIAHKFAKSLAVLDEGVLWGCAARDLERAEAFAAEFGAERAYGDYETLLARPEIDAVYVATTHNFHFDNVKRCLERGKHVLCEKPLTINAAQTRELIALARAKDLFLMEGLWTRFLPAILKARALLAEGAIGDVRATHANFNLGLDIAASHRLKNKALAGGALLDLGIYPINFAAMVFGARPTKISGSAIIGETGVDYSSFYQLEYEGGRRAALSASFTDSGPFAATIQGTKGYLQFPPFAHGATAVTLHPVGREPETFEFPCPDDETFKYEIDHFMQAVGAGKKESDVMPLSETLAILKIMDELRSQWGLKYDGE